MKGIDDMNITHDTLRGDKAYKIYDGFLYEVSGDGFEGVLDTFLPKNIVFTDVDTCGYTFLLNEDGSVYDEVTYYKFEDKYWIASHKELECYFEGSGFPSCVLRDISSETKMVQIEGKKSGDIAQRFYDYDISALNFRSFVTIDFANFEGLLVRFGFSGEFGYQFFLPLAVFEKFLESECSDILNYDESIDTHLKFEVGQPVPDIYKQSNYSLYELGYSWNIDFAKEKFKGREKLLEMSRRTHLRSIGFFSKSKVIPQTAVVFDNEIVGRVCWSSSFKNKQGYYLGLMVVNKRFAHAGVKFITQESIVLTTVSSPYCIPESWKK
jgi:cylF protein